MHLRSHMRLLFGIGLVSASLGALAQSVQPALVAVVKARDAAGVQALLQQGIDVNVADVDGTTPLMLAAHNRDAAAVDALLKAGADTEAANRYGATALHTAARNGDAKVALLLLAAGANPAATLPEGETVLMAAARTGNVELVEALLAGNATGKADPNIKETWKGQTALMWAASEGHAQVIRLLVSQGARVDEVSAEITMPEVDPARRVGGFVYSDIPRGRMAALHFAARGGHLEAVKALVEAGANLNLPDADGTNALVLATLNGYPDVAVALLEAGADPKVADKYGRTVLFVAVDMNTLDASPRPAPVVMSDTSYVDVIQLALAKDADVNARLKAGLPRWVSQGGGHNPVLREGATPFLRAAMSGDLAVIDLLLKAGADPMLVTAAEKPRPNAEGGGGPGFERFGETSALQAAAGVGWRQDVSRGRDEDAIETIKLLLATGADINKANGSGNTPLHGAALRGSAAIVAFLLQNGADPTLRNGRNLTAMDIAMGQPDYRILPNEAVARAIKENSPIKVSSTGAN